MRKKVIVTSKIRVDKELRNTGNTGRKPEEFVFKA
jgi:hypothetical protein